MVFILSLRVLTEWGYYDTHTHTQKQMKMRRTTLSPNDHLRVWIEVTCLECYLNITRSIQTVHTHIHIKGHILIFMGMYFYATHTHIHIHTHTYI